MPLSYCPSHPRWLTAVSIPYHHVCAHNELWLGVPLVVRDVVMGLEPDPLLSFGQKPIATRLPLAKLHHCQDRVHTAGHTVISVRRTWNMNSVTKVSTAPLVPKGDQSPSTFWVCGPVNLRIEMIITICTCLPLTAWTVHSLTVQLTLTLDTIALMSATT